MSSTRFQRILVPVDFSEYSDAAVRVACALAHRQACSLTLLHVLPPRSTGVVAVEPFFVPPRVAETLYQERLGKAENELELATGLARKLAPEGTTFTAELESGGNVDTILRFAGSHDLVVMGSHGLSGAARFLLGSVSEKVSRASSAPVLVVPADDLDNGSLPRFDRVLVGVDYSPSSERAARLAADLAEPGGTVELVHVWAPPSQFLLGGDSSVAAELNSVIEEQRSAQADRLAASAAVLQLPVAKVQTYVANGAATDGLLQRAAEIRADVVVVGTHSRDSLSEKLLGTVADRVLRHADCAVLLVPPVEG